MKRFNNLFDKIHHIINIEEADCKARVGKECSYGVERHDKNKDYENLMLSLKLFTGEYKTSKYSTFIIREPKERLIYRLPYYPDRIVHHAIMNILEPIWKSAFTRDTYSCIKGRGIHALFKKLRSDLDKDTKGTKYCLKLDIKKFYPSIDHSILKGIIRKKIKDRKVLNLLDEIIESAPGVPIGNYLSQYFANLYLAYFDHWVKEELKVKYYYRYADDLVLLSDNKQQLRNWFAAIRMYLSQILKLTVKDNFQIFPVDSRGIDYVGYVLYHNYTKLRKAIKLRMFRKIKMKKEKQKPHQIMPCVQSYFGWMKYCNSKHLIQKVTRLTGLKSTGWWGKPVLISSIKGKKVYVVTLQGHHSNFSIQYVKNGKSYDARSKSLILLYKLTKLVKLPTVIKINNYANRKNKKHSKTK